MKKILIMILALSSFAAFSQDRYYTCESYAGEADLIVKIGSHKITLYEKMWDKVCYRYAMDLNAHLIVKGLPNSFRCGKDNDIFSNLGKVMDVAGGYGKKYCPYIAEQLNESLK